MIPDLIGIVIGAILVSETMRHLGFGRGARVAAVTVVGLALVGIALARDRHDRER